MGKQHYFCSFHYFFHCQSQISLFCRPEAQAFTLRSPLVPFVFLDLSEHIPRCLFEGQLQLNGATYLHSNLVIGKDQTSVRNTKPSYNYTKQARDGLHSHASLKTRQMQRCRLNYFSSKQSLQAKCPTKTHIRGKILHILEQSSQYTTRFLTNNNLCNKSLHFPRAEFSFSTLSQLENA